MTEKASRGEPNCPPPFGYVMRDKKYYPDEESGAANIVREVFTRYAGGEGQREIAVDLGARGIRTKFGGKPENRWIDYMLHNPCYIGMIRWSLDGARACGKRDYHNENIMTVPGHHEPLISQELWETVQKRLAEQKKMYSAYAKKDQPVEYMLKGLVRCSVCGSTLAVNGQISKKNKVRALQCCNYARGSCHTSHSISMTKIEAGFIEALEQAVKTETFAISPPKPQTKKDTEAPDYDKLIALEQRRLERAKDAYLAEIDTIEQYKKNKEEITKRIAELEEKKNGAEPTVTIDTAAYAKKVAEVVEFIKRDDVAPQAKNEALRTIIEKVVFEKAKNHLAIYFHA
jgi:hypothetical protein